MCRADGMVFDDGVALRLADDRFLITTTTGNAAAVLAWMEEWLQTEWPELRVRLTSVTEHWATVAVVGPRSRKLLAGLTPDVDLGAEAFGFLRVRERHGRGRRSPRRSRELLGRAGVRDQRRRPRRAPRSGRP